MSNAKKGLLETAELYHGRIPGLRQLPFPVIGIISAIAALNIIVWVGVGAILVSLPSPKLLTNLQNLQRYLDRRIFSVF
jgi:high-affinity nickel-transport protein